MMTVQSDDDSPHPPIFVTGANGALGGEVCFFLRQAGFKVYAVSRAPIMGDPDNIVVGNVFDPTQWFDRSNNNAHIVHLAGLANPRVSAANEDTFHAEHSLPHGLMIESLLQLGWIGRMIYSSSGGTVYGDTQASPIAETHPCNPIGFYGLHKVKVERILADALRHAPDRLFMLRISNLYGTRKAKTSQGVIPILADHIRSHRTFTIFGDGTAIRDYVHAEDVATAALKCLRAEPGQGGVYNIGSGEGVSLNELIEAIELREGIKLSRKYEPAGINVSVNILNCAKAKSSFGWVAQHKVIADIQAGKAGV